MSKRIISLLLCAVMLFGLCACGGEELISAGPIPSSAPAPTATPMPTPEPAPIPTPEPTPESKILDFVYEDLPEEIYEGVPKSEKGRVSTWEYGEVYYPAHYDKKQKYNILFLLAGFDGKSTTWFDHKQIGDLHAADIIDAMVYLGYAEPMLIFTYQHPGYAYAPARHSADFLEKILPCVADNFPTYIESNDKEGFKAARDHIAMAGFSNGSFYTVTSCLGIWPIHNEELTLLDCVSWLGAFAGFRGPEMCNYVEDDPLGTHKVNFMIWEVGTEDENGNQDILRAQYPQWCKTQLIRDGENSKTVYYDGKGHTDKVALMSLYNALLVFFRDYELNETSVTVYGSMQ